MQSCISISQQQERQLQSEDVGLPPLFTPQQFSPTQASPAHVSPGPASPKPVSPELPSYIPTPPPDPPKLLLYLGVQQETSTDASGEVPAVLFPEVAPGVPSESEQKQSRSGSPTEFHLRGVRLPLHRSQGLQDAEVEAREAVMDECTDGLCAILEEEEATLRLWTALQEAIQWDHGLARMGLHVHLQALEDEEEAWRAGIWELCDEAKATMSADWALELHEKVLPLLHASSKAVPVSDVCWCCVRPRFLRPLATMPACLWE